MRIGYDAKRLYSNFAGLGNYSRTLVRNVAEYHPEHDLRLYTTKQPPHRATDFFAQHTSLKTTLRGGWDKALWRSRGMVKDLVRDGVELYHGLSHELPFGIHKSGVRTVVTMHDVVYRRYPQDYSLMDRRVFEAKFTYACQRADHIIAISESTRQDVMEYFGVAPERISVVYQACDPLFYGAPRVQFSEVAARYGLPSEYLLVVGSIFPRKNLGLLLQALAMLPSAVRLPLVLVGRGAKHKEELMTMARELGVLGDLHWIENLEDNEHLQVLYVHACAMVYPSRYEGFGIPVVEALLSGTPVVTTRVSSLPEAGGPAAQYVDPQDANELAEAIRVVVEDEALREAMAQEGKAYAQERFGNENTTEALMAVYEGVMNR